MAEQNLWPPPTLPATPRPANSASTTRRPPGGGTPPRRCSSPSTRPRRPSQAEGFTEHQSWDFAAHARGAVSAAAALPLLRPLPQAGGQAGRLVLAMHLRGDAFTDEQKAPTSPTTRPSPYGTPRCRPPPRPSSPPRSATSTWPTTTSARPRAWTWEDLATTPETGCTSPRWPAPGSPSSPASAACATTTGRSASRRDFHKRSHRIAFRLFIRGRRLRCRGHARPGPVRPGRTASRST